MDTPPTFKEASPSHHSAPRCQCLEQRSVSERSGPRPSARSVLLLTTHYACSTVGTMAIFTGGSGSWRQAGTQRSTLAAPLGRVLLLDLRIRARELELCHLFPLSSHLPSFTTPSQITPPLDR